MKKATIVLSERERARQRKAIWESFNGCDCPVDAKASDRCTPNAIRCNGRLKVVMRRLDERGLDRVSAKATDT